MFSQLAFFFFSKFSHNVIVDINDNVKLANYHRARGIKDITTSVAEETDGVRWLCPEKTNNGTLPDSMPADVYRYVCLQCHCSMIVTIELTLL